VAALARLDRAMLFHLLPQRERFSVISTAVQGRNRERRRARWLDTDDILENPLAASNQRSTVGLRGDRQYRAFPEQPAAYIQLGAERDAAELASVHIRYSIVLREPFIDERVIRSQEIDHIPVFADEAVEEQFSLTPERLPQVVVEIREERHDGI